MKFVLLIALFCSYSINAQSQEFNPETNDVPLYQLASYTNVGDAAYSIEDIQLNNDLIYKPLQSENHSVGFTSDNFWIQFKLTNSQATEHVYYLETARPITDVANLYQIAAAGTERFKSGDQIAFSERQVNHRATVFKIKLPPNSTQHFYVHLKSDGETINIPLNLYNESEFLQNTYHQQLFLGLFYGVLLLAGIIYLFFYISLKERSFLYYGLYVFSIALLQAALDGLLFEFVWPESGYLNSRMVLITALLSNLFLLKYCEHFLDIKSHFKNIVKYYQVIYVVIISLFTCIFINEFTLKITYPISNVNGLISLLLILFTVFVMRYRKIALDAFFSIGILFLVIGLLGFVMNNLSLLPNNFYTENSAKFGSGLEVIFLSLSMTNLIRKLREEKEVSQALALKKSEEISEVKTYFMSNMSHELRTPLNAILGATQEQLEQQNGAVDSSCLEIIKNASYSLLSNINDILDFEKIEKNELILKHDVFKPLELLQQISENWKLQAENKGLHYTFQIKGTVPKSVLGDSDRFIQIINNVLGNAVKFTKSGTVSFEMQCVAISNTTSRFSFHFSDTGVGIPLNLREDVFDSFSQMRYDNKRQFGGLGLGLTIVNHLVKRFEGNITIDSEEGVGTDVYIDIPLEINREKQQKPLNPLNNDSNAEKHILIVEDNVMNQMIMKKLLQMNSKFTFEVAENGLKAINMLKETCFDVVLMDLQMPIMDGYEATEIIRSGQLGLKNKNIPIIAVTADAMQETQQKVIDMGMTDYMTKPVNKALLFDKIGNCTAFFAKPA
ncbi:7TM diverse intracellular signaling domain-containing protein [Bizionia sp.]|uniref:hybrid sensor histidine kinase/response regulator n=1 Tax=Bizionia sp. TaxID=1954480 RepID=UPI003A8EB845